MKYNKNYIALFLSSIINNFGDVLFDLFIVWRITEQSDNILNAVYLIGSSIMFRAIIALFTGILVDEKNKKKIIIFSNISSALIILLFSFSFTFVLENIWLGIIFILLNDINNEIFERAYVTLSAELLSKEDYIKFQAKCSIINRMIIIVGSSIVGFMISFLSNSIIFIIDIFTFIICALLVSTISYKETENADNEAKEKDIIKNLASDLKYTFSIIFRSPFIIKFTIIIFILNFAYGYIPYILPVTIASYTTGSVLLGLIKSSIAIGDIMGLLIVTKLGQHVSTLFKISMIGNAVCMLLLFGNSNQYIILLIFTIYGILDSITQPLFNYTATILDDKNRGKILGGIDTIILLSPSIGMYLITNIMNISMLLGYIFLATIFLISFFIVIASKELRSIHVKQD